MKKPPISTNALVEENEWMDYAECRKYDTHTMFPNEGERDSVAYAKSICSVCPVATECLDSAQGRGERFGIWGGMTTEERKQARRRERRRVAVVAAANDSDHKKVQNVDVKGDVL